MKPTKKLPLFLITAASGMGKSTACQILFSREKDYLVLESDILWDERFNTPENNYAPYRSLWMELCAGIAQGGKPVVLCGCCVPEQFETRPQRGLFSDIYYLALVAEEETLLRRMTEGRGITDSAWIQSSVDFNRWLRRNAGSTTPPVSLLDVTDLTPQETAQAIHRWVLEGMERSAL